MPAPLRLSEALEAHLALRKVRLAPSSYEGEATVLRRFLRFVGDLQCRNLTPEHVETYMASRLQPYTDSRGRIRPPLGPCAWNLEAKRLRPLAKYLARRGLTRHDLLQNVDPMRIPRVQRLQVGADRIVAMIENARDERDRALLAVLAGTALRHASVVLLRVGDVDLAGGTITAWASKTKESLTLPITADLDRDLRRWLACYSDEIGRPLDPEDYLLPARESGRIDWVMGQDGRKAKAYRFGDLVPSRPLARTHNVVQQALHGIGLPTKGQGAHTLRRSVARLLFDRLNDTKGFDHSLRVVAALLGHSDVATTQTYLGISADRATLHEVLRGQSLLRPETGQVVPLRRVAE